MAQDSNLLNSLCLLPGLLKGILNRSNLLELQPCIVISLVCCCALQKKQSFCLWRRNDTCGSTLVMCSKYEIQVSLGLGRQCPAATRENILHYNGVGWQGIECECVFQCVYVFVYVQYVRVCRSVCAVCMVGSCARLKQYFHAVMLSCIPCQFIIWLFSCDAV